MRDLKSLLLELKEHATFLEHHEVRLYLLLKGEYEKKKYEPAVLDLVDYFP
jgi:hypothetical protein